jgi:hypothetical protein
MQLRHARGVSASRAPLRQRPQRAALRPATRAVASADGAYATEQTGARSRRPGDGRARARAHAARRAGARARPRALGIMPARGIAARAGALPPGALKRPPRARRFAPRRRPQPTP